MGWWDEVRVALQGFLDQHGVLAGFLMILIEEAGVPVPVPGDFLMLALGVHAHEGRVPLWQALLVMEVATLLGASFLHVLAARAGRGLVYRYGRYMHLTPERLDRAARWLLRGGSIAIVLGQVTPRLRIATVIVCEVFKVPSGCSAEPGAGRFPVYLDVHPAGLLPRPPLCWTSSPLSTYPWVCSARWCR